VNELAKRWHDREEAFKRKLGSEIPRYQQAAATGDFDTALVFAGEGLDLVREVLPAATIVERLIAEAEKAISQGADLLR
jgi:nitronate monooxygenase